MTKVEKQFSNVTGLEVLNATLTMLQALGFETDELNMGEALKLAANITNGIKKAAEQDKALDNKLVTSKQ